MSDRPGWSIELRESFEALKTELRVLTDKFGNISNDLSELRGSVKGEFKELSKDFSKYRDDLKTTQGSTSTLSTLVFSILGVAGLAVIISTVLNFNAVMTIGGHSQQILAVQNEFKKIDEDIAEVTVEIGKHSTDLRTATSMLNSTNTALAEVENKLSSSAKILSETSVSVEELKHASEAVAKDAKGINERLSLLGDTKKLAETIALASTQSEKASVQSEKTSEHVEALIETVKKLNLAVDKISFAIPDLSQTHVRFSEGKKAITTDGRTMRFRLTIDKSLVLNSDRVKRISVRLDPFFKPALGEGGTVVSTAELVAGNEVEVNLVADESGWKLLQSAVEQGNISGELIILGDRINSKP